MRIQVTRESKVVFVLASVLLGIVLMVAMLVVAIVMQPLPPEASLAVRVLLAMGAGFASAGLLGSLKIEGDLAKVGVVAGGGFAVFIVVYAVEPGIISALGLA